MSYLKRQKLYLHKLERLLAKDDTDKELGEFLNQLHPADAADLLEICDPAEQHRAFGLLSTEQAAGVMEEIDIAVRGKMRLLESVGSEKAADVVEEMSDDDRVDFLGEIPDSKTEEYFRNIDDSKEEEAKKLYHYPDDTAGGLMTLDFVTVREGSTVDQALNSIRKKPPRSEIVYYIYVLDDAGHLNGVFSIRDLIASPGDWPISKIIVTDLISVEALTDQEEVAELCTHYDLLALPVVDSARTLLGMVTLDDVVHVIHEEATEDIYLQSAIATPRDSYLSIPLFNIWKGRVIWLIILLAAAVISGRVMKHFEEVSQNMIALTFFIPMLLGTAGNAGAQSATIIVRSLALGQIRDKTRVKMLARELITGVWLGLTLAVVGFGFAFAIAPEGGVPMGVTLSISLFLSIIVASMSGVGLPLIFNKLGWDPALMSGPFLTTIVDVFGLLIYFSVAQAIL